MARGPPAWESESRGHRPQCTGGRHSLRTHERSEFLARRGAVSEYGRWPRPSASGAPHPERAAGPVGGLPRQELEHRAAPVALERVARGEDLETRVVDEERVDEVLLGPVEPVVLEPLLRVLVR